MQFLDGPFETDEGSLPGVVPLNSSQMVWIAFVSLYTCQRGRSSVGKCLGGSGVTHLDIGGTGVGNGGSTAIITSVGTSKDS